GSPVAEAPKTVNPDSGKVTQPDTTHKDKADTGAALKSDKEKGSKPRRVNRPVPNPCLRGDLINLNVLLLELVAAAGFLGNMIYISISFTTFVGAGMFKKSWLLWY